MKLSDLEDGDQVVTKAFVRTEMLDLKVQLVAHTVAFQRRMAVFQRRVYAIAIVICALIIIEIVINHYWQL